jgi:hypothetical protein
LWGALWLPLFCGRLVQAILGERNDSTAFWVSSSHPSPTTISSKSRTV